MLKSFPGEKSKVLVILEMGLVEEMSHRSNGKVLGRDRKGSVDRKL